LDRLTWRIEPILLPPDPELKIEEARRKLSDPALTEVQRKHATLQISFLHQLASQIPILLTSLQINEDICIVQLPGEPFVEYQLYAQEQRPDVQVAVAGYGDLGPSYIPLEQSFSEGGYEVTWAFAAPEAEALLKQAIQRLTLQAKL